MAAEGYVDIVHNATGLTSTVLASTLPAWETAGWTRADNGSEESEDAGQPELPLSSSTENADAGTPPPADVPEE